MTISFSGLASGLDTSSWVEALVSVKQSKVSSLKEELTGIQSKKSTLTNTRTSVMSLRTAIEKLTDKKFGGNYNLFAKNNALSSDDSVFTATATTSAVRQSYDISVQRLATSTKATSIRSASAAADGTTKLSDLGVTNGRLSLYVDGVKNSITIDENTTINSLASDLSDIGVNLAINEGLVTVTSLHDIVMGASTDETNFLSLVGLEDIGEGNYQASKALYKANSRSVLNDENAGFAERISTGSFTIGNATFYITESTTLEDIINSINNNEDAQASAYWDDTTGKLTLTSTKEGSALINIEKGESNFTDVMGLTKTENGVKMMEIGAQELGVNAQFTINGTAMTSSSNTVNSDISKIVGVTLTLKGVSEDADTPTSLRIEQDSDTLKDAIKNFVSSYNDAISQIETVTAKGADLQRESSLTSLKNSLRNYATGRNSSNGGAYKLLSQLGISTAAADGANLSTDTNKLEFDENAFLQALEEDPASVESLLGGENGILNQMENSIENSLRAVSGFFDVKQSTLDSDISKIETKIKKQQDKVSVYKAQLEKKFSAMETLISQMQQNYSSFLS